VIHGVDLASRTASSASSSGPRAAEIHAPADGRGARGDHRGRIDIGGRDVTRLDPSERGVAMVFQTYALYPHMTVAENMGFGLKMNGHPKAEIARKVAEAAAS
jgi:lactose/L-arabinose transport system ATP-binding protein